MQLAFSIEMAAVAEQRVVPLAHARNPGHLPTIAFAGVIDEALQTGRQPLIQELSENRFQKLLNEYFPGLVLVNGETVPGPCAADDEFHDLVNLLLEFRAEPSKPAAWLCYAIASAAMGENHLWQDMGLPDRATLSQRTPTT